MANNDLIGNQKTATFIKPEGNGTRDYDIGPGCEANNYNQAFFDLLEQKKPDESIHTISDKKSDEPAWKPLNLADLKFEGIVEKFSRLLGREFIADVRLSKDEIAKSYFMDIRLQLYVLGIGDRIVKYPDGWIEAAKERWLPARLKRRWPVKYKVFDAFAYWPTLHKYLPEAIRGAPMRMMFMEVNGGEK